MKYYKVKPEADNKYNKDRTYFFVGGELLQGRALKLYAHKPDAEEMELIEREMGVGA